MAHSKPIKIKRTDSTEESKQVLDTALSKPKKTRCTDFSEELSDQVLHSNEPLATESSMPTGSVLVIKDEPIDDPIPQEQVRNDPLALKKAEPGYTASVEMAELVLTPLALFDPDDENPSGSSGRRKPTSEEIRSMWNLRKVFSKLGTDEQCVRFAEERGLVKREKMCSYHRKPMSMKISGQFGNFQCGKGICRNKKAFSRATGTWFENVHLSLPANFQLLYAFSVGFTYDQAQRELVNVDDQTVISNATISDWYNGCRETVVIYQLDHQENVIKIGGPNKKVHIEKHKIGKRKFTKRINIEGYYVFTMIEDGNNDIRFGVCRDSDPPSDMLLPIIKSHVQEGSIVYTESDQWRDQEGLSILSEQGYIHIVVASGTHSQSQYSKKKAYLSQYNKTDYIDWLVEYCWRKKISKQILDPFEELLKAIAYVHKPQ